MRRSLQVVSLLALAAIVAYAAIALAERGERRQSYAQAITLGSDLERGGEPARAALVYEQALELELTDEQAAELTFRRTRALIDANDLNTALGLIQSMHADEGTRARYDFGALLLELGRRAKERGDKDLALVAFRLGQSTSPERYEAFGRELEAFIRPLPEPAPGAPSKD